MLSKFWMVYCLDGGAPTHRHDHRETAEREAKRLAGVFPDQWFVVLEGVSATRKTTFQTVTLRDKGAMSIDDDDGIPF